MLQNKKKIPYKIGNYNFLLVAYTLILSTIGFFMVYSATSDIVFESGLTIYAKQLIGIILGIICMVSLSLIDYKVVLKFSWIWYIGNILVLLYVRYFSPIELKGAKRWISLPGFGTIQPSEFSKIVQIITYAVFLTKVRDKINKVSYLVLAGVIGAPPILLILLQPNLSTTIVCCSIVAFMIFMAGISYKWVIGVLGTGIVSVVGVVFLTLRGFHILKPHQIERIVAFMEPEKYPNLTYQQRFSVMAIAGGKLNGKGLNNNTFDSVKNGNFLSEEQGDFIWAVVGEELGFIGCCVIIILIGLVVIECLKIAKSSKDFSGRLVAGGIATLFAIQSFVNIGVATLILPNTGIPLPFISSGLSSLLSSFICIGLVLNIGLQRRK